MIEIIVNYWYLLILIFILGSFFYGFIQNDFKKWLNRFSTKPPIIKKYWIFVVPFLIITTVLFYWLFKKTTGNEQALLFSLVGQGATLIFAIYAGYLAFQQLMENRLDKLREYGDSCLLQKHYKRAMEHYLEVLKIKPRDYNARANILEIYLLNGNFEKFEKDFLLLNELAVEGSERLACKYLAATRFLLDEHNSKAKEKINEIINFIKKDPQSLKYMDWTFEDIKNSTIYERMEGDSKVMIGNLIKYLSREMKEEDKKRFENGDYLLK